MLLLAALAAWPASAQAPPKRESIQVLALYFGDHDAAPLAAILGGFQTRLEERSGSPVWIYSESLAEPAVGNDPDYDRMMAVTLARKYRARKVDFILAFGDYALQFASKHRAELSPDAQLLYFVIESPHAVAAPGVTGLTWKLNLAPTVELALAQNPKARRLLLISGDSLFDQQFRALSLPSIQEGIRRSGRAVEIEVLNGRTFDQVRRELSQARSDTVAFQGSYHRDSAGQTFNPESIIPVLSQASRCPIYGPVSTLIGRGVVGGSVADFEALGARFGEIAARVLRGEKPDQIAQEEADIQHPAFDWREMKRWGIRLDQLPPGSMVINREYTLWERYKWQLTGGLVLIVVETGLILLLLRLRFVHRRAEQQARQGEQAVRELSGRLINAQEEERSRIARELHDDINQQLSVLSLDLQNMEEGVPPGEAGQAQIQALWQKTHDIAADIQRISHELHSSRLDHLGLTSALRGLCQEFAKQHKLGIDFQAGDVPSHLDAKASLSLFRIAQECLRNVAKHSQARNIRMELARERNSVVLRVSDDGVGFDLGENGRPGLGMVSMQERLRLVGGRLRVRSGASVGTQVEAWVPLPKGARVAEPPAAKSPAGASTRQ